MKYLLKSGQKLTEFEIREKIMKVLKEEGYLTIGLLAKKVGLHFPVAQKLLLTLELDTNLIKGKKFYTGKCYTHVWFRSK